MRFEIKTKDISDFEKAKSILFEFRDMSIDEYSKEKKNMDKKLNMIPTPQKIKSPEYDCAVATDKGKLIFWNSFFLPDKVNKMGIFNPFKKAIKTMEENLHDFLSEKGVETEVKYMGN